MIGQHTFGHEIVDCSHSPASLGKQQQQHSYVRTSAIKLLDSYQIQQHQQHQRNGNLKRKHDSLNEVQVRSIGDVREERADAELSFEIALMSL